MLIFGVNLKLVWLFVTGRTAQALKNEEFRWYAGLFLLFWLMIAGSLILDGKALVNALGLAFFQTASAVSTTGFASADFNRWPSLCRLLLPLITMFGACTGSSGGGLKIGRVLLAGKTMKRELHRSRQPQIVKTITLDHRPVSEVTIQRTLTFILIYLSFFLCGWILLAACGLDLETSGSAVLTCMNNSGTGLNAVGPLGSYAAFSPFAKLTLCLIMLAGRLEFYPIAGASAHSYHSSPEVWVSRWRRVICPLPWSPSSRTWGRYSDSRSSTPPKSPSWIAMPTRAPVKDLEQECSGKTLVSS